MVPGTSFPVYLQHCTQTVTYLGWCVHQNHRIILHDWSAILLYCTLQSLSRVVPSYLHARFPSLYKRKLQHRCVELTSMIPSFNEQKHTGQTPKVGILVGIDRNCGVKHFFLGSQRTRQKSQPWEPWDMDTILFGARVATYSFKTLQGMGRQLVITAAAQWSLLHSTLLRGVAGGWSLLHSTLLRDSPQVWWSCTPHVHAEINYGRTEDLDKRGFGSDILHSYIKSELYLCQNLHSPFPSKAQWDCSARPAIIKQCSKTIALTNRILSVPICCQ